MKPASWRAIAAQAPISSSRLAEGANYGIPAVCRLMPRFAPTPLELFFRFFDELAFIVLLDDLLAIGTDQGRGAVDLAFLVG